MHTHTHAHTHTRTLTHTYTLTHTHTHTLTHTHTPILTISGGNAYLSLEDQDEPYLAGIKYTAMPPTKRFRDMEQLSGEGVVHVYVGG